MFPSLRRLHATPPKTSMASPKIMALEKVTPFYYGHLLVSMLNIYKVGPLRVLGPL